MENLTQSGQFNFYSAIIKEYGADHDGQHRILLLSHDSVSHCWNSSNVMTSRSHFFFSSLAFSLQA